MHTAVRIKRASVSLKQWQTARPRIVRKGVAMELMNKIGMIMTIGGMLITVLGIIVMILAMAIEEIW